MLEQRLRTESGAWGDSYQHKQTRKMLATLALLLVSLAVVLVRDHSFWFGASEAPIVEQAAARPAPTVAAPTTPARAKAATTHVSAASSRQTDISPKQAQTRAGKAHVLAPATINSVKVQTLPKASVADEAATPWAPATSAAERVRMTDTTASLRQPMDVTYPLLAQQMKVEGSVVLQVLISADGTVQSMRVLSGPTILATAAREAVRNWKFKPYLINGQAVETSATVTVNLTIKVLDNTDKATAAQRGSLHITPAS